MNLSYRNIQDNDIEIICNFPTSEEELFYMYPKAHFPLDKAQLSDAISQRKDSIVVICNDRLVAFANFYEVEPYNFCSIGNVIVDKSYRKKGICTYLVHTMEKIAKDKYYAREVHISCFNHNTEALMLYSHLGFTPYDIEIRTYCAFGDVALIKMRYQIVE